MRFKIKAQSLLCSSRSSDLYASLAPELLGMPVSPVQQAKRALVALLLSLAQLYKLALTLSRESSDDAVAKAVKRVALKVHPDKGGTVLHTQELMAARDAWQGAKANSKTGRPAAGGWGSSAKNHKSFETAMAEWPENKEPDAGAIFRVQSEGVLLTYFGFLNPAHWRQYVDFLRHHLRQWHVKYWCTTLEATKKQKLHVHTMFQFTKKVDWPSRKFAFDGLLPRADVCDSLGEGFCKRKLQASIDRAMFYCWADKIGTQRDESGEQCTAANYKPCWTDAENTYVVNGRWPETLWKARKLTTETYEEEYLFQCRDGVLHRKRNLDACKAREEDVSHMKEIEARIKRIRNNRSVYKPFPAVPEADRWLHIFKSDRLRYPLLVVSGASSTGKTEWAKSLFQHPLELRVGSLDHFPEGMRAFRRGYHDGIVLDDVRDFGFLVKHQEKLQGKYDSLVEFASTPGGQLAYTKDLFAVPVVVTVNNDTENRDLLTESDWLGKCENRVLLTWPPAPTEERG